MRVFQVLVFVLLHAETLSLSYTSIRPYIEVFEVPWFLKYLNNNIQIPLESPDRIRNRTVMNKIRKCPDLKESYDFIIVGSGAAGSVLANRLSENKNFNVLLLEAGDEPFHMSNIPYLAYKTEWTGMDWQFKSEPQKYCCQLIRNKSVYYKAGKCLGGTTSMNYMAYTRANRMDLENWVKLGNKGWGYDDLYPYYLKLEDYQVVRDKNNPYEQYHRQGGPMTVEIPSFKTPLAEAFLQAGYEMNYPLIDYNGPSQIGFMYPPVTIRNGSRCSTYVGYLKPAMSRTNLQVLTNSFVTKILIDSNNRATGVIFDYYKTPNCQAKATKEVIVSAGVIQSPKLLMLSGIGPKKTLQKFKIPVKVDLPGVGQNLQDHVIFSGNLYVTEKPYTFNSVRYMTPENIKLWERTGTGPMTVPSGFEGVAFLSTKYSEHPEWSDVEIYFRSDNVLRIYKPYSVLLSSILQPPKSQDAVNPVIFLLRPKSRGYVTLRSPDPRDPPIIQPNLLKDKHDVLTLVEGNLYVTEKSYTYNSVRYMTPENIKLWERTGTGNKKVKELMKTKAMQQFLPHHFSRDIVPGCLLSIGNNDKYDECVIRQSTINGFHPVGTCKMGNNSDPTAVVDMSLRVLGLSGLRVVDASVFPVNIAAHPMITIIAIAEKISDEIKKDFPI